MEKILRLRSGTILTVDGNTLTIRREKDSRGERLYMWLFVLPVFGLPFTAMLAFWWAVPIVLLYKFVFVETALELLIVSAVMLLGAWFLTYCYLTFQGLFFPFTVSVQDQMRYKFRNGMAFRNMDVSPLDWHIGIQLTHQRGDWGYIVYFEKKKSAFRRVPFFVGFCREPLFPSSHFGTKNAAHNEAEKVKGILQQILNTYSIEVREDGMTGKKNRLVGL